MERNQFLALKKGQFITLTNPKKEARTYLSRANRPDKKTIAKIIKDSPWFEITDICRPCFMVIVKVGEANVRFSYQGIESVEIPANLEIEPKLLAYTLN